MNIFQEMVLSVYSYGSYSEFLKNKKGKVFGFGVLLVLIYFAVTMLIPSVLRMGSPAKLAEGLRENVPNFELEDGTLWVDDVIELDNGNMYVYIDTDPNYVFYDADEMEQHLYGYSQAVLIDSEKIIIKNNGELQGLYFSDMGLEFNREDLIRLLPWVYVMYVVFMIVAYIWMTALFFFGVLFVALIGMIVASCMNYQLTFGQLYLLGIYSRTLPLIIKAIVSFLPVPVPFFWILNFGISVFILAMAIRKMKEHKLEKPLEFTSSGFDM